MADPKPKLLQGESKGKRYPLESMTRGGGTERARIDGTGRIPPQATDLEKHVLGKMIYEAESAVAALEILEPDDFYSLKHQLICEAIVRATDKLARVDLLAISEELKAMGELDTVGGAFYLTSLIDSQNFLSGGNIVHHCLRLKEYSLKRNMIRDFAETVSAAYDPTTDVFDLIDEANMNLTSLSLSAGKRRIVTVGESREEIFERLKKAEEGEGVVGIPTGLSEIDRVTHGFQDSDYWILAGVRSMGKSTQGLFHARHICFRMEKAVAYFNLESAAARLSERVLYAEAKVDSKKAKGGRLLADDWERLQRAADVMDKAPFHICDYPGIHVDQLVTELRRLVEFKGVEIAIIDYLQKIVGSRMKGDSREREIAYISEQIANAATNLGIPIIALAQLNSSTRNDRRPSETDLRESKSPLNDCDVFQTIHRPEYFGIEYDKKFQMKTAALAEHYFGKVRDGARGEYVHTTFVGRYYDFINGRPALNPDADTVGDAPF